MPQVCFFSLNSNFVALNVLSLLTLCFCNQIKQLAVLLWTTGPQNHYIYITLQNSLFQSLILNHILNKVLRPFMGVWAAPSFDWM